jgi:hypothetical protein
MSDVGICCVCVFSALLHSFFFFFPYSSQRSIGSLCL